MFLLYTHSLISSNGFSYHFYTDDAQIFLSFPPSDSDIFSCISTCLSWMHSYHLKLKLSKPPLPPLLLLSLSLFLLNPSPSLPPHPPRPSVTLYPSLSYSQHISTLARSCHFYLNNIHRICPFLTDYSTQLLVEALVLSRLDNCNSLLAGLPASAISLLQLIQNSAAHLVFSLPCLSHATLLLHSLHWLPITACIQFKTLVVAYRCLDLSAPSTSYQKTKEEYERIQTKRAQKRLEAEKNKQQRQEALRIYKQKKMETYQILSRKTKKGQPNLNVQMEYLLQKIQDNQSKGSK
ncbi:UNVERIFIED_CONTAM: hypothetical protein FKN15_046021 [Acipenser sinensis]